MRDFNFLPLKSNSNVNQCLEEAQNIFYLKMYLPEFLAAVGRLVNKILVSMKLDQKRIYDTSETGKKQLNEIDSLKEMLKRCHKLVSLLEPSMMKEMDETNSENIGHLEKIKNLSSLYSTMEMNVI